MEVAGIASGWGSDARDMVAKIEQKALQLSALLRELDNRPFALEGGLRDELEAALDQLSCRIAATRVLDQPASEQPDAVASRD